MKPSIFIAKKYFFAKRQFQFITIISLLSFIGIAIGVAVLIVVISIFNGFQSLTKDQFLGFDPHIQVFAEDNSFFQLDSALLIALNSDKDIKVFQGTITFSALLLNNDKMKLVEVSSDNEYINKGNIYRDVNKINEFQNLPKITLGIDISNELNIQYNDTITILPLNDLESLISGSTYNSGYSFMVGEIFNSNIKNYDATLSFIDLEDALIISNPENGSINLLNIRLNSIEKLNEVTQRISKLLPDNLRIRTWEDLNPVLFAVMKMEKISTFSILSLIIILAIFNIFISLTMTVLEKRKDIGIIRSLGADKREIYNIFFFLGSMNGFLGTLFGVTMGLGIIYLQQNYKIFSIDSHKYIIDALPLQVNYFEIVLIAIFSFVLSAIASLYPSKRASEVNIYKSIRTE